MFNIMSLTKIDELDEEIDVYEDEIEEIESIADKEEDCNIAGYIKEDKEDKEIIDKLKAENDKLKAENDKLKAENDKLKAENDKLKAENDKLKAENLQDFNYRSKIEEEYRKLVNESVSKDETYNEKINSKDIVIKNKEFEIDKLNNLITDKNNKLKEKEDFINNLKKELAQVQHEMVNLKNSKNDDSNDLLLNTEFVGKITKYKDMPIDEIFEEIKRYMLERGVKNSLIVKDDLDKLFGADNIKQLILRGYLINTRKGVTL